MGLSRHVFGYDVFVSYARDDASDYAAALRVALESRNFRCFLDREHFKPGPQFQARLKRGVGRSSVFVLLASPEALLSPFVALEVSTFAATGREILVIQFPEAVDPWPWPEIARDDPAWITEEPGRLKRGEPSPNTIAEIEKHFTVTRQTTKRVRFLSGLAVVLVGLLAVSVYYGLNFRSERDRANRSADEATRQTQVAEGQRDAATAAVKQERIAREQEALAKKEALRQQGVAEQEKRTAELQRGRAEQEARIAVARLLVLRAQQVTSAGEAELAQLLVTEALAHYRSEETDTAFRTITRLTPVIVAPRRIELAATAMLPDKWRAQAATDGIVRVRNGAGRLLERWDARVNQLDLSPDASLLFGVGADAVRVWDVKARKELPQWPVAVKSVMFSPDREMAFGIGADGVAVWSIKRRQALAPVAEPKVVDSTFSKEGHYLALVSSEAVVVFDVLAGVESWRQPFEGDATDLTGIAVADSGQLVVVGTSFTTGRREREGLPKSKLTSYARGSSDLVWDCEDCSITVESFADETAVKVRKTDHESNGGDDEPVQSSLLQIAVRTGDVVSESEQRDLRRDDADRDPSAGTPSPASPPPVLEPELLLALSADGKQAAVGGLGTMGQVCRVGSPASCRALRRAEDARWFGFSPDGKEVMAAVSDYVVRRWSTATGEIVRELPIGAPIKYVAYAPSARRLAVLTAGNALLIYGESGQREAGRLVVDVSSKPPTLSPDGRYLAAVDRTGAVHLWELGDHVPVAIPSSWGPVAAVGLAGNHTLAAASSDGTIKVHDLVTGTESPAIPAGIDVEFIAMSPDGHLVAASGTKGGTVVWDLEANRLIARLAHKGPLEFSPDGTRLITGTSYVAVAALDMIDHVCSMVRRRLSAVDWSNFVGSEPFAPACK